MFSRESYLMGRDIEYPLTIKLEKNLDKLLEKCLTLEELLPEELKIYMNTVNSGYRPGHFNEGYAKLSAHLTCEAVDLKDEDGRLKTHLKTNLIKLRTAELYMEHPDYTKTWCHLQTRPTKLRIFRPY